MQIGILGGTFDPIHIGHLNLAKTAYEDYQLDKVLVMPTGNPPHKKGSVLASLTDRIQMIKLAIEDISYLEFSNLECDRDGYVYSADTMRMLNEQQPENDFFFIMGADSLMQIESWHEPDKLFRYTNILVAIRDDIDKDALKKQIEYLSTKYESNIFLLNASRIDIASHEIREQIANTSFIKNNLPSKVYQYIMERHLYEKER